MKLITSICKGTKEFLDVRILTERKQKKVKVSPGRPFLKSAYKNKWEFKHTIQWELNKQAIFEALKNRWTFPFDYQCCLGGL